jgi:hypothetical protein
MLLHVATITLEIKPMDPFFIHHFDSPGLVLVTHPRTGPEIITTPGNAQ